MKFIAIIAALCATLVAAAPAAEPAPELQPMPADLDKRQTWCGDCDNGKQICCSAVACYAPTPC